MEILKQKQQQKQKTQQQQQQPIKKKQVVTKTQKTIPKTEPESLNSPDIKLYLTKKNVSEARAAAFPPNQRVPPPPTTREYIPLPATPPPTHNPRNDGYSASSDDEHYTGVTKSEHQTKSGAAKGDTGNIADNQPRMSR